MMLKTSEVCERLGVGPKALKSMMADGRLPYYRLSPRVTRFASEDVEAVLVRSRREGSTNKTAGKKTSNRLVWEPGMKVV